MLGQNRLQYHLTLPDWDAFPSDLQLRIINPHTGAHVRCVLFTSELKEAGRFFVSIYLDINDNLGLVGQPYFEIYYPSANTGGTYRYLFHEQATMWKDIFDTFNAWHGKNTINHTVVHTT